MQDWRTLDALNKRIIELAGWKKNPKETWQRYADYLWTRPDGQVVDCENQDCPPDYTDNAQVAVDDLLPGPPHLIMIMRDEQGWRVDVDLVSGRSTEIWTGNGPTLALAICNAFLDHYVRTHATDGSHLPDAK